MILRPDDPQQLAMVCRADEVADEPLVRAVERVVDRLDLSALYARYSEVGRSFFDPAMQLRVLFFAYCDGVRSCRGIARHIRYDVRYRYFCGHLRPDFRTINRFRLDHLDLLSDYFAEIVLLLREWGLVDDAQLALDSSKFRASTAVRRPSRRGKRETLRRTFRRRLAADAAADELAAEDDHGSRPSRRRKAQVNHQKRSDPDARFMKTREGGTRLSYNAHVVVDRHQVIVAADVSNNADDSVHFGTMLRQTEAVLGCRPRRLLADGGYYAGRNISEGVRAGIDLYLPVSASGGQVPDAAFHRDAFVYDAASDSYRCPQGEQLHRVTTRRRRGTVIRVYRGRAAYCGPCPCREPCTRQRVRRLEISEHYVHERRMRSKLASATGQAVYRQRQTQVEPVFGNIKFNMGFVRFRLRRLAKVHGEFLLVCLAHNLRKLATRLALLSPMPTVVALIRRCCDLFSALRAQPAA